MERWSGRGSKQKRGFHLMYIPRGLGSTSDITSLIRSIALSKGVDPALALAVAQHESAFNPSAKNPDSSAAGLFQLINATQQTYGVTNPYDPTQNAQGGVSFLSDMLRRYNGDQNLALMAYACGPGNVDRYLNSGSWPAICNSSYPADIARLMGGFGGGASASDSWDAGGGDFRDFAESLVMPWDEPWFPWVVGFAIAGIVLWEVAS